MLYLLRIMRMFRIEHVALFAGTDQRISWYRMKPIVEPFVKEQGSEIKNHDANT